MGRQDYDQTLDTILTEGEYIILTRGFTQGNCGISFTPYTTNYIYNLTKFTRANDETVTSQGWTNSTISNASYFPTSGWNSTYTYSISVMRIYIIGNVLFVNVNTFSYDNNNIDPTANFVGNGVRYGINASDITKIRFVNGGSGKNEFIGMYKVR